MEIRRLQWPKAEILYIFVFHAPATHQIYFFCELRIRGYGGNAGESPPPPQSTHLLFSNIRTFGNPYLLCPPPHALNPTAMYGIAHC